MIQIINVTQPRRNVTQTVGSVTGSLRNATEGNVTHLVTRQNSWVTRHPVTVVLRLRGRRPLGRRVEASGTGSGRVDLIGRGSIAASCPVRQRDMLVWDGGGGGCLLGW